MHRIERAVTTADFFEMSERELGRSGLPDNIGQDAAEDWALRTLQEAMHEAGTKFIDEHPGLFKVGLT